MTNSIYSEAERCNKVHNYIAIHTLLKTNYVECIERKPDNSSPYRKVFGEFSGRVLEKGIKRIPVLITGSTLSEIYDGVSSLGFNKRYLYTTEDLPNGTSLGVVRKDRVINYFQVIQCGTLGLTENVIRRYEISNIEGGDDSLLISDNQDTSNEPIAVIRSVKKYEDDNGSVVAQSIPTAPNIENVSLNKESVINEHSGKYSI